MYLKGFQVISNFFPQLHTLQTCPQLLVFFMTPSLIERNPFFTSLFRKGNLGDLFLDNYDLSVYIVTQAENEVIKIIYKVNFYYVTDNISSNTK